MKALKIFFLVLLASIMAGCSSDTGDEEPHVVLDPATNPAAIIGRWDEVGGAEYYQFSTDGRSSDGIFIHYNRQTTSGAFMYTTDDNTIHCKPVGGIDIFQIVVAFDQTDKNLATFTTGSHTINVKRTQQ